MAVIAFVGLGQMGSPMASNLLKQGHQLSVFDVNPDAIQTLVEKGARPASSPAQAAKEAEFVITMLPNGDLVRSVLFGDQGVCEGLSQDALVIDMSTIHPLQTDKLIADMRARGFSMFRVSRTFSTNAGNPEISPTFNCNAAAFPPDCVISCTTCCASFSLLFHVRMIPIPLLASLSAAFLPSPRLPPVTNAIRCVIRNLISGVVKIEKELIRC